MMLPLRHPRRGGSIPRRSATAGSFYRACRPCQRRQEADGAEMFVPLERAVLNLASPDVIRVVDVSYEVFLAWREGLVPSG